ncbi:nitroreductase (plasmid) [Salinigranum rubrum]|uniref:Nitroreductase n=1 Tax=Salinigranum rubrum TaxID=755307 RepID=A0A2I8VQ93_9EURY|nr:nitroreductase family protein [Salinigranum rubrum]AUV84088.1 nitroreductase [Salinigranum rubrum]
MESGIPKQVLFSDVHEYRSPNYDIATLLLNRWSPRSMTGESLDEAEFMPLFDAARWAPSAYNSQPWRFLYAIRGSEHWDVYFDLLSEWNKRWATQAALLVLIVSKTTFEYNGEPAQTHSFDTGAAWENLALEGARRGLVVHGIGGFDYERAREVLAVPGDFAVEAMAAIGVPGSAAELPVELQERETPSDRKPLDEVVIEGTFDEHGAREDQ